jgi:alkylation response protein AidB-like acyl-CoA dehydrogenase
MSLRLTPEHDALDESLAGLVARHAPTSWTRDHLDDLSAGTRPAYWQPLVDSGFLAMHLPAEVGGGGADGVDVAVAVETAGYGMLPGPFVPTVLAGLVVSVAGGAALAEVAPLLLDGATAACAFSVGDLTAELTPQGARLEGAVDAVVGAPGADVLVLGARSSAGDVWLVVDAASVQVEAAPGVDTTRSIGRVSATGVEIPTARILTGVSTDRVRELAATLLAAEASGVARWCFSTALDHVKVREQFGRPVGSFQAIKHKVANLFVRVEVMAAAAWDAARALHDEDEQRALAAAEAAIVCLPGARDAALDAVTLLGGIGFSWEHDISLYWRRATAAAQLLGGSDGAKRELAQLVSKATRRFTVDVDDPQFRAKVAEDLDKAATLGEPARRHYLAETGYVAPHYPAPYGLAAGPVQQIVISQEFGRVGIVPPRVLIGEFVLPMILTRGTDAHREKFVAPTLSGDITWCQLFSEPEAGSDLASLRTKAERVEDGWRLNGQKVWTTNAADADWAICLARTDPDVPKHKGISYFLVDMKTPGVEVRPLRQTNGEAEFNEVFLSDVVVPDEYLVGEPGEGWGLATATLGNERLTISAGSGSADALAALIGRVNADPELAADPKVAVTIGRLMADEFALDALNLQSLLRRLEGLNPGAAASVLKLAYSEHRRSVATAALELAGAAVATGGPETASVLRLYLSLPGVLIGGGTREIQLNIVSERVLGMPRG